jgi:hypothetical protein
LPTNSTFPAGTAHTWSAEFTVEIQKLRAIEMEAIQERVLSSYEQDLTYLAEELKRVQQELRERDYGYCDTQQLFLVPGRSHGAHRQKVRSNRNSRSCEG